MISTPIAAIFIFCLVGCSITSWYLGKQRGIADAVTYLVQEGLLTFEEDEDE